jgi:hypothetical protein
MCPVPGVGKLYGRTGLRAGHESLAGRDAGPTDPAQEVAPLMSPYLGNEVLRVELYQIADL